MRVDSETKLLGIFGHPVRHSLSPRMHNAAFEHLGLKYCYLAFDVDPSRLSEAVAAIRALNMLGANVTIPHKVEIIKFLDELSRDARLMGAVNTIHNRDGVLTGYNTDGCGMLEALEKEAGFVPADKKAVVIGAGGAARAACVSLLTSGAREVVIINRTEEKAFQLRDHISSLMDTSGADLGRADLGRVAAAGLEELPGALEGADLLVNATSVGMHGDESIIEDASLVSPGMVVCDFVYRPTLTRFLEIAKSRGAKAVSGTSILLYQGVQAFAIWTGMEAPVEVMRRALLS